MSKLLRALIPLFFFIALAALLGYGLTQDPRAIPSTMIDKPTPEFARPDLADSSKLVTHEILRGEVTMVNVWGTWCPSCRQEHGELVRIAREEGIKIIGFNWRDDRDAALRYLRDYGNPYTVTALVGETDPIIVNWGVVGAPESFIVDKQGKIRYKHTGPISRQLWDETLRPIVDQLQAES